MIAEGISIGLGGLIRTNHVKRILRSKGNEIRAAQSGGNNPHPKPRNRTLRKEQIATLSYKDAEPWLRAIGKPIRNSKPLRLAELMQHFEGKPDDYELSL